MLLKLKGNIRRCYLEHLNIRRFDRLKAIESPVPGAIEICFYPPNTSATKSSDNCLSHVGCSVERPDPVAALAEGEGRARSAEPLLYI